MACFTASFTSSTIPYSRVAGVVVVLQILLAIRVVVEDGGAGKTKPIEEDASSSGKKTSAIAPNGRDMVLERRPVLWWWCVAVCLVKFGQGVRVCGVGVGGSLNKNFNASPPPLLSGPSIMTSVRPASPQTNHTIRNTHPHHHHRCTRCCRWGGKAGGGHHSSKSSSVHSVCNSCL
jgi:hypothetical protein